MNHLINYLRWRGDLGFEQSELNEVDRFALAYASYAELKHYMGDSFPEEEIPLVQVAQKYRRKKRRYVLEHPEWKESNTFVTADRVFAEMARTHRFFDVWVSDYEQVIRPEETEQFAAVCLRLSDHLRYISFSGTDETIIGWLEDFHMSYKEPVPAQRDSGEYLFRLLKKYPNDYFYLGGHSKGGNLAIYAAATAAEEGLDGRIVEIDAFDSPGFLHPFLSSEGFLKIRNRIKAYLPEGSLVGLLLFRDWELNVIRNRRKTIPHQHICEGWETLGTSFVRADSIREKNISMSIAIQEAVTRMTPEQLKNMFDRIAVIFEEAEVRTVTDFASKSGKLMSIAAHEYHQYDNEERSRIGKVLLAMIRIYNESQAELF